MGAQKVCECCGQVIRKLNPHRMDHQKVQMLMVLARAGVGEWVMVKEGNSAVVAGVAIRAPYRARAHASRLVWFGLAEHQGHRTGMYRITENGLKFLQGNLMVPDVIYCKDGKVVEKSTIGVAIGSVKNLVLDKEYWDNYFLLQRNAT